MAKFELEFDEFKEIKKYIKTEHLIGAEITSLIEEIQEHYELANRFNWQRSRRHYGDLLVKLIKNYGN